MTDVKSTEIFTEEIIRALETEETLTLATCAGNRVTIRPMSHICQGLAVYFQTDRNSLKMQQIKENPNVALCVGTYELEGTAAFAGKPLDAENTFFAQLYKIKFPHAYALYSALDEEILVKVTLTRARQWRYIDGEPVLAEKRFDAEAL